MRRDLPKIYALLRTVESKHDGGGCIFSDKFFENPVVMGLNHFVPQIITANLIYEVVLHPETIDGLEIKAYRLTWKGQGFLDLFEKYAEYTRNPPNDILPAMAEIALLSYY